MKKLIRYSSILIALYPILSIYATPIPGISFGEFALLAYSLIYIIKYKRKIHLQFRAFTLYAVLISLIMMVLNVEYPFTTCIFHVFSIGLIVFLISVAIDLGDVKIVDKWLRRVAFICFLFFCLQFAMFRFTGISLSGIIPYLPLSNGEDTASFRVLQMGRDRLSSLFEEPAHFSEFISIVMPIFLFNSKTKKEYCFVVLLSLCVLLSSSALGAISIVLIWGYWLLNWLRNGRHKWIGYIGFGITIFLYPMILANDLVSNILVRLAEISGEDIENSVNGFSSYVRVMRGYIPFWEFGLFNKITGCGLGSLLSYVSTHPTAYFSLFDGLPEYINTIQYLLIGTGIIGTFLFLRPIYIMFRKTTIIAQTMLMVVVTQMFASGIYASPVFLIAIFYAVKGFHVNESNRI